MPRNRNHLELIVPLPGVAPLVMRVSGTELVLIVLILCLAVTATVALLRG